MEGYLQYRRLHQSVTREADSRSKDKTPDSSSEVEFEPDDAHDPRNWSKSYKLFCTSIIWLLVFVTGWASSADSTAHEITAKDLHVSEVAESLATSMYLFGVGAAAMLTGPVSETLGRLTTYLGTFFIYLIWVMASALSPNFAAQIIFRLLTGFFAAASMSIYGGSLADMFDIEDRAYIWPFFALSPILGPIVAPIANGWIADCASWRWIDWTTLIISSAAFIIALLFLPETSSPIILSFKAQMMRQATGSSSYQAEHDKTSLSSRLTNNLSRIVYFVFREPTTLLFGAYITLLYLLIYGFLEGFDYIFSHTYSFNTGQRYTPFAAIAVGVLLGLPYVLLTNYLMSKRDQEKSGPERRLAPALFTSPLLAISLFWIGWTNRIDISYWSDVVACCVFGFALFALFTSTYHYLLETYGTIASSALAAITAVRYLASGGMVLVTEPMYEALTVRWTMTLLGAVAALLTPVPWAFWFLGTSMRKRSKWASKD